MLKKVRKWCRILHRDIGFFFIGLSVIYGLSGIALNHLKDWNPNYSVQTKTFRTDLNLRKSTGVYDKIMTLLDRIDDSDHYKKHYYPEHHLLKIFLEGGSSVIVNTDTGEGTAEFLTKRPVFYMVNFLHYNPHRYWMRFSDVFAAALIFFALSSLFMVRGKKGPLGRGGIYVLAGLVIPILFYIVLNS